MCLEIRSALILLFNVCYAFVCMQLELFCFVFLGKRKKNCGGGRRGKRKKGGGGVVTIIRIHIHNFCTEFIYENAI